MSLQPAPSGATCDVRSCGRPAVYTLDRCLVCKQHADLAYVARVPSAKAVLRYFPWLWKLTPELLNAYYDRSGAEWEETHGDGTTEAPPPT